MAVSTPASSPALPDVERHTVMPRGFRAGGWTAGIKASGRPDLGLVVAPQGASAAAVLTPNAFAAAPVKLSRASLAATSGEPLGGYGYANVIVSTSGSANAGDRGDGGGGERARGR